jgi:hypothetical protein
MENSVNTMTETPTINFVDQARQALTSSAIYDLRQLDVRQQADSLIISGSVSRFYYKQLAQEILLEFCPSSHELINTVDVR